MPSVAVIDDVKVYFYVDDHPPPHFHALFAEYEALIEISPLKLCKGAMPRSKLAAVLNWAKTREPQLLATWLAVQAKRKPEKIT